MKIITIKINDWQKIKCPISTRKLKLVSISTDKVFSITSKQKILRVPNIYLWNGVLYFKTESVSPNKNGIHFRKHSFFYRTINSDMKSKNLSKSNNNNKCQNPRTPKFYVVRTDLYDKGKKQKVGVRVSLILYILSQKTRLFKYNLRLWHHQARVRPST